MITVYATNELNTVDEVWVFISEYYKHYVRSVCYITAANIATSCGTFQLTLPVARAVSILHEGWETRGE
jgi:hypothetical protein